MKIFVAHSADTDFQNELYKPLRESELNRKHEIFLPHEGEGQMTKDIIEESNVFLAEVSMPSTGSGIEIGWAHAAGVPIFAFHKTGTKRSSSVGYVARDIVEYKDSKDLIDQITLFLKTTF